jgi:hypothetical protein
MKLYWSPYIQKIFWIAAIITFIRRDGFFLAFMLIVGLIQAVMTITATIKGEDRLPLFPDDKNTYLDKFIRLDNKNKKLVTGLLFIVWLCFIVLFIPLPPVFYIIANSIILLCILARLIITFKNYKKLPEQSEKPAV